jgi:hypothetical protein
MQQSKAHVIKTNARNLKATIAARKAEYVAYRYGTDRPYAQAIPTREQYAAQLEAVRCTLIEAVHPC